MRKGLVGRRRPLARPKLVRDAPARLLIKPRAKRAAIASVLELSNLLRYSDQRFLHHIIRLVISETCFACHVTEQRRVIVIELAPGGLLTPILQSRQQAQPGPL